MYQPVFHEPWWLDAVAPGAWQAATVTRGTEVVARWPWSHARRGPVSVLGAPPLTPYLGPVVDAGTGKTTTRLSRDRELQEELLEQLPDHQLFKTTLTLDHRNWTLLAHHGWRIDPRVTYLLDDTSDLDTVWSGFSDSTRRAVRKAERRLGVRTETDAAHLGAMAALTFRRQGRDLPYEPELLDRVVDAAVTRGRGTVLTAVDDRDAVHASILVVWDDATAYYLAGGADPERRDSAGLSLLLWEGVKTAAAHAPCFDFEGSMVPGVERFFRSFGGRPHTYLGARHASRPMAIGLAGHDLWRAVRGR